MKRAKGFTLTEVIVAMVLLAALGGLGMLALSGTTSVASGAEGQCYNWGRFYMESFYEDITAANWPLAGRVLSTDIPNTSGQSGGSFNYGGGTVVCERYQVASVVNGAGQEEYRRLRMVIDDNNCGSASPFPV